MFLYEKRIVYFSLVKQGEKVASAGFVRVSREKDAYILDIHIKQAAGAFNADLPLYLVLQNRKVKWTTAAVKNGEVNTIRSIPVRREMIYLEKEVFGEKELCGVMLFVDNEYEITGYWQEPDALPISVKEKNVIPKPEEERKEREVAAKPEEEKKKTDVTAILEKTVRQPEVKASAAAAEKYESSLMERKEKILLETASEDKWEQLQKCYKNVHPFGDDRLFLSVEPKDFIVMQAPYQRLVNNSFLLHGFYNYRHLILGPDKEIGNGDESCFYLGVPGTYFEREKMVAVMFGFEGFECSGAVEIGKFGYYMRRVEL